ncbi:hypothetical protein LR48_Vigan10g179200 [Vigna angularis]|uniref:Uncharacterized protein n=1 Tax=Phaseolus angularis TaxID=3914 RepID=A0A0L9VLI1_PHAAN|nr:hypothetical protein LR48_Vigan10g179200 [Vigna angularis]
MARKIQEEEGSPNTLLLWKDRIKEKTMANQSNLAKAFFKESASGSLKRPQTGGAPTPAEQLEARFGSIVHVTQHASRDPADLASKLVFYFEFLREISSELTPFFSFK